MVCGSNFSKTPGMGPPSRSAPTVARRPNTEDPTRRSNFPKTETGTQLRTETGTKGGNGDAASSIDRAEKLDASQFRSPPRLQLLAMRL